jgi:hypothetical protein
MQCAQGTTTAFRFAGILILTLAISAVTNAGGLSTAAHTAEVATNAGPKTLFVLKCYDRAFAGDPKVYDDCFTEDFKSIGPETRMMSRFADGSMRGREYIKAYHDMNTGDAVAWKSVMMKTAWSLETDTRVVRLMRNIFSQPKRSYAGIDTMSKPRAH